MMRVGIILLGVGFILFARVHSLPAFYGAFVLMSVGWTFCGMFPLSVAIVNWFEKKRARAISTMSIGFALGGVAVPLVAYSLNHFGWRDTATASGVLIIVLGLPLTQVMRRRPEDYGEVIDGEQPEAAAVAAPGESRAAAAVSETRDFTFSEAVRTPAFWLISLGHGSALLVVSAVNVHVVSHLKGDLGYSLETAGLVMTLMTSMQLVGMLVGGALGDRTDSSALATACMGMHMLGLLLVAYAFNLPMIIGFAVLHGLAWGIRGPLMQAIRADYFGRSSYGMIMGFSSVIIMFGNILGPLIAGVLADQTGSYEAGFTILALLAGLGSIFFILAKKPARPRVEAAEGMGPVLSGRREETSGVA
jgi:MFS family permease